MIKTNRLLMLIVAIALLMPSCFGLEAHQDSLITHLLDTNNEFDAIWNVSDIRMGNSNRIPDMVGAPGKIIIYGWESGGAQSGIIFGLDSSNGNIGWTIPGVYGGYIIAQGENLYRGTAGTATVQSYSIEDGKLLWDTRLPWSHSTTDLYFAENKIFVHTNDSEFFILNGKGEIIDSFSETLRTFLEIDGVLYMKENFSIKAIDFSSKKELWRLELDDDYGQAPIFDDGTIFLRTWDTPTYLYSIDQSTGKVNWEVTQDVLSNLYVADDKVYFINRDSCLVAIDRFSGNETFKLKFSPAFDLNKQNSGYVVTGDPTNNVLAISFGDNGQIMGLRIINP
jgi:outer membrane protein assembly factor BamB